MQPDSDIYGYGEYIYALRYLNGVETNENDIRRKILDRTIKFMTVLVA